ncbi:hypothetical protein AGMMS49991_07940 [Spirochaetia bacterium]|nr:hypothetical protein AGMMS49991_07940 [Spirochaetia bacterium]
MAEMTDEEYDALDELWTRTTPKLATGPQRGFFTERRERMLILDEKTIRYIKAKAGALHQTPAELVADFVRRDLAASE